MKTVLRFVVCLAYAASAWAQASNQAPATTEMAAAKNLEVRERYEKALLANPLQDQAFDRIYEGYLAYDGIEAWTTKLKQGLLPEKPDISTLIILGRILDRQFKTDEALQYFEQARAQGESRPEFRILYGTLLYEAGKNPEAIAVLTEALNEIADSEKRAEVCRMLGALYIRQGNRDDAIVAWKKLVEQHPTDLFAQIELADIYEENQMWDDVITTHTRIVEISQDDPYRKCRALRAIGDAQLHQEKFTDAIATFEKALDLVSPGNWLFEDLKGRLVTVYQDMGDLEGLTTYLLAKLSQAPGDIEFRDLLAETYTRTGKLDQAESEYNQILERDPSHSSTYEKLLTLYGRMQKKEAVVATFEKLIELFPNEPDYLRRLGETFLLDKNVDMAKQTWQRLVTKAPTPENQALLAQWFEEFEFPDDAIAAYEFALQAKKDKELSIRLATLKFQKGEEDAAVQLWVSTLDESSSTAADYAEVASIIESHNLFDKAEPPWRKAIEKDSANQDYSLSLAKNLTLQERAEEALPLFEHLAAQTENEFLQDQGERGLLDTYSKLGVLDQKQKEWEKAAADNPTDAPTLFRLARMNERAGNRPNAIELYQRCIELMPNNADYMRTLVTAYKSSKQIEEAIDLLKRLVEKDPKRAGGYYRELLDIYLAADLKMQAIETGKKIVELAPSDPEARLDLAQVYISYQDYDNGFEQYRYALRLEPNEPDYYRQYGQALFMQENLGEAQEAFRKMIAVAREDDTRRQGAVQLAGIYLRQGNTDELVREYENRIRSTPKKLAAYQDLSAIYQEVGNNAKSIETLESGLEIVDDKTPALQALVRQCFDAQNFEKVITYYEQLIAASGKPGSQELERLGQVYAQLGDVDKAKATWNRIVEEDPKNLKSYTTLSRMMQQFGFTEESLAAMAKALEFDPTDFKLRFNYAQQLAQADQSDQALEQLRTILDLGDPKKEKTEEKDKEKKVASRSRGSGAQYGYGFRYRRSYYPGSSIQGGYNEARGQIIQAMAGIADASGGIDMLIEEFKKRAPAGSTNYDAKRDLMLLLSAGNRAEEAATVGEEILGIKPDDAAILEELGQIYAQQQVLDKAIERFTKAAELQPPRSKDIRTGLISLYFQSQQDDKATQTIDQLLTEYPDDPTLLSQLFYTLRSSNKNEQIAKLRERVDKLDPRYRYDLLLNLAQGYVQTGNTDEAARIYTEIIDAEAPLSAWYYSGGRKPKVYIPNLPNAGQQSYQYQGQNIGYAISQSANLRNFDQRKFSALFQLLNLPLDDQRKTEIIAKYETAANSYAAAASTKQKDVAWGVGKVLIAYAMSKNENEKALQYLDAFKNSGMTDLEWYNVALFVHDRSGKYEAMTPLYDELEHLSAAQHKDIVKARANTAILINDYERAAACLRELLTLGVPPAEVIPGITQLHTAGESERAKTVLEEYLAGVSRNSDALMLLADIYNKENNFEKALVLAKEAWERQARSQSASRSFYSSYYYYGGYYYGGSSPQEGLLGKLYQYSQGAGKAQELVKDFEERLAKQPASVELHKNLAVLYAMNDQRDKAIDVYKQLIEKQPHLMDAKMRLIEMMSESGKAKEALTFAEEVIKKNPSVYRAMSWRIRDLYQRFGKTEELAKMEEGMMTKATTPDQMQDLAWRFQESGDYDKAIEMYKKALKADPNRGWMMTQLARAYQDSGRMNEALESYTTWMNSPITRSQQYVDFNALAQMVGFYRLTGRLEELKAKNEADLAAKPTDFFAKSVKAEILLSEKQFVEALKLIEEYSRQSQNTGAQFEFLSYGEYCLSPAELIAQFEKLPKGQNFYDLQRLARLYAAVGDPKKVYQHLESTAAMYGGSWGMQEAITTLANLGLWKECEEYYGKTRRSITDDDYVAREMDELVAWAYDVGVGFKQTMEQTMQDKLRGPGLALATRLYNRHEQDTNWCLATLRPLIEKEPDRKELLEVYANTLYSAEMYGEALPVLEKLAFLDENNEEYRRRIAQILLQQGREQDALAGMTKWVEARQEPNRLRTYAQFLVASGRAAEVLRLRDAVIPKIDESQRDDVILEAARIEKALGNIDGAKTAFRANFEKKADTGSYQSYLDFLYEAGLDAEAYQLLVQSTSGEYEDRWRVEPQMIASLCFKNDDPQRLIDFFWKFVSGSDQYNIEWEFRRMVEPVERISSLRRILPSIREKVLASPQPKPQLIEILAQAETHVGNDENALDLYDRLLKQNPAKFTWRAKKAAALHALRRFDDEIAAVQDPTQTVTIADEITATLDLAAVYYGLNRNDDVAAVFSTLTSWAKDGGTSRSIGLFYAHHGDWTQAVAYLEAAWNAGYRDEELYFGLLACYVKLARTQDFERVLSSRPPRRDFYTFVDWLTAQQAYDVALPVAEKQLQEEPVSENAYIQVARIQALKGDSAAVFATFASAWSRRNQPQQKVLIETYASFLREQGLVESALTAPQTANDPVLVLALAKVFAALASREDKLAATSIREKVGALPIVSCDAMLAMASALTALEDKPAAAAWCKKALEHPEATSEQKLSASSGFVSAGDPGSALPYFEQVLTGRPGMIITTPSIFEAIAKAAPPERLQAAIEYMKTLCPYESHQQYYAALALHHSGKTSEGLDALVALSDAPNLSSEQLTAMADLLEKAERMDAAAHVYQRIARGGYGRGEGMRATEKLIRIEIKRGNADKALELYTGMLPSGDEIAENTRTYLAKHVSVEMLDTMKAAIAATAQTKPQGHVLSDLIGLYHEAAEYAGQDVSAGALADTAGVSGDERIECDLWDTAIEDWSVTGIAPYSQDATFTIDTPYPVENCLLSLGAQAKNDASFCWKTATAKETIGYVTFDSLYDLDGRTRDNKIAYALSTITSPDERDVVISFGCDDFAVVWINGEVVHRVSEGRVARMDQDRFLAHLKPGENVIIVKLANKREEWRFCMAILKNGEGVTISPAA